MSIRCFVRSFRLVAFPYVLGLACTPGEGDPGGATDLTGSSGSTETMAMPEPGTPTTSGEPGSGTTGTTSGSMASTSSGSSGEGSGLPAMCGDGQADPGEQCDEGADNSDVGACSLDCKIAICGDGRVHAGVESCDLGADNNDAYGGCGGCQWNAFCGDGVQDPEEQCDAGVHNGSGESPGKMLPCTVGCRWDARLVFLSSAVYDGDFGGLDGADLRCRNLAEAAGISTWPSFRAWLSDVEVGPLERFVLIPAKPYGLPTGERVADSLADLVLNGPGDGIRVDELGKPLSPSFVWTNTGVAGEPHSAADHCKHWDSAGADAEARVGLSHMAKLPEDIWQKWREERWWTSYFMKNCNVKARLYCFEN